jgi:hypothetical protein
MQVDCAVRTPCISEAGAMQQHSESKQFMKNQLEPMTVMTGKNTAESSSRIAAMTLAEKIRPLP